MHKLLFPFSNQEVFVSPLFQNVTVRIYDVLFGSSIIILFIVSGSGDNSLQFMAFYSRTSRRQYRDFELLCGYCL